LNPSLDIGSSTLLGFHTNKPGLHISRVHKRLSRHPDFSAGNYEAEAEDLGSFVSGQIIAFVSWAECSANRHPMKIFRSSHSGMRKVRKSGCNVAAVAHQYYFIEDSPVEVRHCH
jgi:hypothetical protein